MFVIFLGYSLSKPKKELFLTLCLIVLFLSSMLFSTFKPGFGQTALIFSDDFESGGLGNWTGTKSMGSGITASVQAVVTYEGTSAMAIVVADGPGENGICIYKDFGNSYSIIHARAYVQLTAVPAPGGVLEVFGFSADGWLPNAVGARVDIINNGGMVQWRLNYYNNGWQAAYTSTINPNTWYCVEMKLVFGGGLGETHLYVDDVELVSKTGLTNTALGSLVRYFSLGIDDESGGNILKAYFDSVVVSGSYIGPRQSIPPSPTAPQTATSEPTTPTTVPTLPPTPTPTTDPTMTPAPTSTPTSITTPTTSPAPTPIPTPTPTAIPTPIPSPNVSLFEDSFESGAFTSWTHTGGEGNHTQTVETANPHHGSHNAKFTADTNSEGWIKKSIPSSPVIYLQQHIKLTNLPPSDSRLYLGTIQNSNSNNNVDLFIENNNGQYYWGVYTSINGAIYHDREPTPSNPRANIYYCVELCRDATNSRSRLWVDGTLKVDASRPHSGNANGIYIGLTWATASSTIYVDCIKISTSYIPPEMPLQSTPTPAPTTNPPSPTPAPVPTHPAVSREVSITKPIQASWIANDGTLYAGSSNTLYKSPDQGITWQPLLTFSGVGAEINCVFVNQLNYVFVSPSGTNSLGLWRSTDGGQSWSNVLPLSTGCSIWSMTQDSNGNLFAGIYTTGNTANATILKSTDNGAHWTVIYHDTQARHVHCITVDLSTNTIYAAIGDVRVVPGWYTYVIRAAANGVANASWRKILTLPQMLSIEALYTTDQTGKLMPLARLFATDYDNGQIYRTTDDMNFNLVLDTGTQSYGYWIRTNNLNGDIYASFTGGENPAQWIAGIWISRDGGIHWSPYKNFPIHNPYYGSIGASNFWEGTMYYSLRLDSGWQNGIKIYPDYGTANQSTILSRADISPLELGLLLAGLGLITATRLWDKIISLLCLGFFHLQGLVRCLVCRPLHYTLPKNATP
ncbi:MAG: hypothetical protein LBI79_02345, partial [Nitrososphaerota archaeon]|nr:hypothetical protein [Nitrososphaerota archaeon]